MFNSGKCSNDPIPNKAIRLSEAFEEVRERLSASPELIETLDPDLRKLLLKNKEAEEKRHVWKSRPCLSLRKSQIQLVGLLSVFVQMFS
jgi:hypothetical protein